MFLLPACLLGLTIHAQYYFEKLTEENGLSDNRVTCFLKDKTGFLWIGTKNGLNRYDGNSFKIFRPTQGNSISNEVINDIVQDSSGKIWVATVDGLNIYDPRINWWETMMHRSSDVKGGLPSYSIWDLFVDERNRIWIVSDVWELSVHDPVTKKITYYDWPSFKQQKIFDLSPRYRSIQKIERKNEYEWWLATTIGLFSVHIQSGKFQFYGAGYGGSIRDIKYDRENKNVFTVTENGKLFCYDEEKNFYEEMKAASRAYPAVQWNKKKDSNDLLLMAHPDGMVEINKATKEATVITHHPSLLSSLLPGGANSLYTDNTGLTWIGTTNGINKFDNSNITADFIPLSGLANQQTEDDMGGVIHDQAEDKYYVCSINSATVFTIDGKTGNINALNVVDGKPLSACLSFYLDIEKNIWLLTETNVYRYNRQTGKFSLFLTPNADQPVIFRDMLQDAKGNYWLATWRDGLYLYKTADKKFYRFTEKDSLYSVSITSLASDPVDHSIWIGTFSNGIYRYDLQTGRIYNYGETPSNPDYLQLNLIEDIETDASGKTWFITHGAGLYVHRHGFPYEKSLTHLTMKQGLSNNNYFSVSSDNKNKLWLLSGKGLSTVDTSGRFLYDAPRHPAMSFANYAPEHRYPKRIFFNKEKNEVLVAVSGGLLIYYPDKSRKAMNFPVVLKDISVKGRSVFYDSTFKKNKIPYKSNSISFDFAALHYDHPEQIQYEYMLEGADATWKSLGNSPTVRFPNLSSGHYTFKVRAKDENGNLSVNTASYIFRIIPPFWKTGWFYLLAAGCIATLVYLIYKYQLNKKLEVERLRLRISRDLHDDIGSTLSSINIFSKVALNKVEKDTEVSGYLSKIKDSAAHTMESMSDIVWAINPKNDKLEAMMSRMKEFAADICEAKGIDLDFSIPTELEKLSLNLAKRKNLFLVFKEAVNNAVKYSRCNLLQVTFKKSGNKLQMMIRDNGKGFDNTTVTGGNGLRNMKERAEECGGHVQIESIIKKGTSIILEIPITRFGVSANF